MKNHRVEIFADKCSGCGICAGICPARNIRVENKKAVVIAEKCVMCGHCGAVCPQEAIRIGGYDEEVKNNNGVRLDPAAVLDVIRFRRTVRRYKSEKIPENIIGQILEAGSLTHTAKNMQDVSFTVLDKEKESVERLAVRLFRRLKPLANIFSPLARKVAIGDRFFFFGAPSVIVIAAKDKTNGILAAQNMEFVAEAHGLGVLFSGFFTSAANLSRRIRKALAIPKGKKVAATLVLGYPKVHFLRSAAREKPDVKYL